SHAFEVKNLEVPENRIFQINGELQVAIPLLNYPFMPLAETTLAVNYSGMALHFVELVEDYFYNRSGIKRYTSEQISYFEQDLAQWKENFQSARSDFFNSADLSWQEFSETGTLSEKTLKSIS